MLTTTVIIESRHLDTDERVRGTYEVASPVDAGEERFRLVALVADLHPRAAHRSYRDGAATFLDRDHLIVAFYESRTVVDAPGREGLAGGGRPAQDRLFD